MMTTRMSPTSFRAIRNRMVLVHQAHSRPLLAEGLHSADGQHLGRLQRPLVLTSLSESESPRCGPPGSKRTPVVLGVWSTVSRRTSSMSTTLSHFIPFAQWHSSSSSSSWSISSPRGPGWEASLVCVSSVSPPGCASVSSFSPSPVPESFFALPFMSVQICSMCSWTETVTKLKRNTPSVALPAKLECTSFRFLPKHTARSFFAPKFQNVAGIVRGYNTNRLHQAVPLHLVWLSQNPAQFEEHINWMSFLEYP